MSNIVNFITNWLFKKSKVRVGIMYPLKNGCISVGDKIHKLPKGWILKRSLDYYDARVHRAAQRRRTNIYYAENKPKRRLQAKMSGRRRRIRHNILLLESDLKQRDRQPTEIQQMKLKLSDLQNELLSLTPTKKM